jgi:hypothetical protein
MREGEVCFFVILILPERKNNFSRIFSSKYNDMEGVDFWRHDSENLKFPVSYVQISEKNISLMHGLHERIRAMCAPQRNRHQNLIRQH